MAGSEQRPTDDVEGHGQYFQDPEAVDDRGYKTPDDTQGHLWKVKQDPDAGDDTQGHGYRLKQDLEAVDQTQAGDDTEGHMPYRWSQDTEATDEDQAGDDAQGHVRRY